MNFNQLKYFVETVKYGSINKAARKLEINPSSLLAALNSLEGELGITLLLRRSSGIIPTREGEIFYEDAKKIQAFQYKWKSLSQNLQHTLINVHVIPSLYYSVFPDILKNIMGLYPSLVLNTFCSDVMHIEDHLEKNKISITLSSYLHNDSSYIAALADNLGYEFEIVGQDTYRIVLGAHHPLSHKKKLSIEDLTPYNSVDSYSLSNFKFGLYEILKMTNKLSINEKYFQLKYIQQTDCFSLMPSIMKFNELVQSGTLKMIRLNEEPAPLLYALMYRKKKMITPEENFVVREIKKCMAELVPCHT